MTLNQEQSDRITDLISAKSDLEAENERLAKVLTEVQRRDWDKGVEIERLKSVIRALQKAYGYGGTVDDATKAWAEARASLAGPRDDPA